MTIKTYRGSCHCGAVRYEADVDLAAGTGRCNCSICGKSRYWGAIIKPDAFRMIAGEDALSDYQFGGKIAHHLFCRHCGIHAFGVPRVYPDRITVNARCLDGIDPAQLKPSRQFDGRNWEEAARQRRAEDGASA